MSGGDTAEQLERITGAYIGMLCCETVAGKPVGNAYHRYCECMGGAEKGGRDNFYVGTGHIDSEQAHQQCTDSVGITSGVGKQACMVHGRTQHCIDLRFHRLPGHARRLPAAVETRQSLAGETYQRRHIGRGLHCTQFVDIGGIGRISRCGHST